MNADFYQRLEWRRYAGFNGFTANKAFAVSEIVPDGSLWLLFALAAYRLSATVRTVHIFAVPPGDASTIDNPTSDRALPFFLGANNNPPLKSGVLLSLGGDTTVPTMKTAQGVSVQALMAPFPLPQRWRLLACIDSTEAVIANDQIVIDAGLIEVTSDECLPDFL